MSDKEVIPLRAPFEILVDSREKLPYTLQGICADAKDGYRPIEVTTSWRPLETGDYSIKGKGYDQRVAVERKAIDDAFSTFGKGRERFQKELARLASFECAAVVIEAGWDEIPRRPPEWSKLAPKVVFRSILAWQQRYPTIHWWCVPGRRLAEVLTFRILSKYWGHRHERA